MKKFLTVGLLFGLLFFSSGCLDVADAPIPPEFPLFSGELKAGIGHSYAQVVRPNGDLFMTPAGFRIEDDSKIDMYTYNDFAKANAALKTKAEWTKDFLNLDYDLENAFVLVFTMHVTTGSVIRRNLTDHYGTLYFIVGSIQNDKAVKGLFRREKFKIQGIGGSFDGFFTYQAPRDNAQVVAPWLSIDGDGKIMYDRRTGEALFMSLKGTIKGVCPGQFIFEFPFQTKLGDF